MALTSEETARLASLQAAYDALVAGTKTVRMTAGGRTREYAQGDLRRLKAEIDVLVAKRDSRSGSARGALRFRIS